MATPAGRAMAGRAYAAYLAHHGHGGDDDIFSKEAQAKAKAGTDSYMEKREAERKRRLEDFLSSPAVEEVDLGDAWLTCDDVRFVGEALVEAACATKLTLSANRLDDSAAACLLPCLAACTSLTHLDVSRQRGSGPSFDVPFGGAGIVQILDALGTHIAHVRLSQSDVLAGEACAAAVAAALGRCSRLVHLDIAGLGFGDEGMKSIAAALGANSTLTFLDVANSGIGAAGFVSLAEALAAHASLKVLRVGGKKNKLGDDGAEALGAMLRSNGTVTELNLAGVGGLEGVNYHQVSKLVDKGLERNVTLTTLVLSFHTTKGSSARKVVERMNVLLAQNAAGRALAPPAQPKETEETEETEETKGDSGEAPGGRGRSGGGERVLHCHVGVHTFIKVTLVEVLCFETAAGHESWTLLKLTDCILLVRILNQNIHRTFICISGVILVCDFVSIAITQFRFDSHTGTGRDNVLSLLIVTARHVCDTELLHQPAALRGGPGEYVKTQSAAERSGVGCARLCTARSPHHSFCPPSWNLPRSVQTVSAWSKESQRCSRKGSLATPTTLCDPRINNNSFT